MHSRRLIALLLGFWLAGLLMVAYVASLSFRTVDVVMENPPHEASKWMESLGKDRSRLLLRHGGSEVNRSLFETWGNADVALCGLLLITIVMNKSGKPLMILAAVLLLAGLASTFLLTPQVVAVGRLLDFRPPIPVPPEKAQFGALHGMYSGLAVVRILIALGMSAILLHRSQRSRTRRSRLDDVDLINDADHGHINR